LRAGGESSRESELKELDRVQGRTQGEGQLEGELKAEGERKRELEGEGACSRKRKNTIEMTEGTMTWETSEIPRGVHNIDIGVFASTRNENA
jgi:hypothetical protein